jgi:hypothetical protein
VASVGAIEKLYADYQGKAHFYVVYIREAHPNMAKNQFNIPQPMSREERQRVAKEFAEMLKISLPILVDTIDDQVSKAYAGFPDRVCIIDRDGRVALQGARGPAGFAPALKTAPGVLDKLLSSSKQ